MRAAQTGTMLRQNLTEIQWSLTDFIHSRNESCDMFNPEIMPELWDVKITSTKDIFASGEKKMRAE